MHVDSHLHVWRATAVTVPGVKTLVSPQTDVTIESAAEVLAEHGIDRGVLVQPVFPGEDNSYVADCARAHPERFAAVCVVDPRAPGADSRLEHWVRQGCRGLRLRPRISDEAESFGNPATFPLWEAAARLGVVVNVLSGPEHSATVGLLAEQFPQVPIVVDHMGHPDVAAGVADPDFRQLLALAGRENVFIKLSGFYHFSREPFPFRDCWPPMRAVYDAFGPRRLIWGSDYPHVTIACGYRHALHVLEHAFGSLPDAEAALVTGGNALRLYWPAAES